MPLPSFGATSPASGPAGCISTMMPVPDGAGPGTGPPVGQALRDVTPADVLEGRRETILAREEEGGPAGDFRAAEAFRRSEKPSNEELLHPDPSGPKVSN